MTRHHFYNVGAVRQQITAQSGAEAMIRYMEEHPDDYPDFKLINVSFFSYQNSREEMPMFDATICYSITEVEDEDHELDLDDKILMLKYIRNLSEDSIAGELGVYREHVDKTLAYYQDRQILMEKKLDKIRTKQRQDRIDQVAKEMREILKREIMNSDYGMGYA